MQGLTTSIDRVSLTFPVARNQSTHLKKPTRVCFSGSASFPKSRIFSSQIVPLPESAANHFASSSNHIFAHDRRLTKRVSASNDENSPTTAAPTRLKNRLFMVYSCVGLLWLLKTEHMPYFLRYHMTMGLLLDASEFFHGFDFTQRLRIYHLRLWMGCRTHFLVHFFFPRILYCFLYLALLFQRCIRIAGFARPSHFIFEIFMVCLFDFVLNKFLVF